MANKHHNQCRHKLLFSHLPVKINLIQINSYEYLYITKVLYIIIFLYKKKLICNSFPVKLSHLYNERYNLYEMKILYLTEHVFGTNIFSQSNLCTYKFYYFILFYIIFFSMCVSVYIYSFYFIAMLKCTQCVQVNGNIYLYIELLVYLMYINNVAILKYIYKFEPRLILKLMFYIRWMYMY